MSMFFDYEGDDFRRAYVEEGLVADVQMEISRLMKAKGVSRTELARRLAVSPANITQMLGNGDANLTLRTIARIFDAIGEQACLTVKGSKQRDTDTSWAECLRSNESWLSAASVSRSSWSESDQVDPLGANDDHHDRSTVVWLENYRRAA